MIYKITLSAARKLSEDSSLTKEKSQSVASIYDKTKCEKHPSFVLLKNYSDLFDLHLTRCLQRAGRVREREECRFPENTLCCGCE